MKINFQGIKDNAQHLAGIIVGSIVKCNYSKADRGSKFFSTVSSNLASAGVKQQMFPYVMFY